MEPSSISPMETAMAEAPIGEPKKNNKAPIIIASVASVLAVAGIAFGVFGLIQANSKDQQTSNTTSQVETNKENSNTNQDETKNDSTENISKITLPEIRSLLDKYIVFGLYMTNGIFGEEGLTEKYKHYLVFKDLYYTHRGKAANDFTGFEYDLTYDEINAVYHDFFGSSSDFQNQEESFWCGEPFFSEEYGKYVSLGAGCGGTLVPYIHKYEILDYSTTGKDLMVDVSYLHAFSQCNPHGEECKEYITLKDGDKELGELGESGIYTIQNYQDELPQYRFTFTNEDDKYVLTSMEKTN